MPMTRPGGEGLGIGVTPPFGSSLKGVQRVAPLLVSSHVQGRAKSRPTTITLTKTVTLNALSRCFVCPKRGIMLNSNYGM